MTDRLVAVLHRFDLKSRVFYAGNLCSLSSFDAEEGVGHLHLLRSGTLEVIGPDGHLTRLTEPSLLFYPRPTRHQLRADAEIGADLVCASVEFGTALGNPLVLSLPPLLIVPVSDMPRLHTLLDMLFDEAFGQDCGRDVAVNRLTEVLLVYLLRHAMNAGLLQAGVLSGLADPRLSKALQALHSDPARAWTLELMAQEAGMSRARFALHFGQIVGSAPGDYLMQWRISVAQSLLTQGKALKAIADEVGYSSPTALGRAFTQRTGLTPTEWLSRLRHTPPVG